MTRAERLIFLVSYLRHHRVGSVPQLSAACGISQRTVYRDVDTLSRMNIPIYYDRGYRLLRDTTVASLRLAADDLQLIHYAFRNNPLSGESYWAVRFAQIEQKLTQLVPAGSRRAEASIQSPASPTDRPAPSPITRILGRFLRAVANRRMVSILTDKQQRIVGIPLLVHLDGKDVKLVVAESREGPCHDVMTREVRQLRILEAGFEQRPLELLRPASKT